MQIDFVKLWREAQEATATVWNAVYQDYITDTARVGAELDQAAARVLEAAFTAAVEEERRRVVEGAAGVAESHKALGYMSDRERTYCHEHGEEIASSIRALILPPDS